MKHSCFFWVAVFMTLAFSLGFAQEGEPPIVEAEAVEAAPLEEAKPSVAQALSGTRVPGGCLVDFTSLMEKDGFDVAKFVKDLPVDVAKVKVQLKSPFGKPKDSDKTSSGVTVGCIRALPESPAEVTALLKDISLKLGVDLAVNAVTSNVADNSIPTNVATESSGSGGETLKSAVSIGLVTVGLGAIIYGVMKNNDVAKYVNARDGKAAVDAESSRNIGYGVGAALLAGGIVVYLVF